MSVLLKGSDPFSIHNRGVAIIISAASGEELHPKRLKAKTLFFSGPRPIVFIGLSCSGER